MEVHHDSETLYPQIIRSGVNILSSSCRSARMANLETGTTPSKVTYMYVTRLFHEVSLR